MGYHEGGQGYAAVPPLSFARLTIHVEFSGTLVGFDDYVSKWLRRFDEIIGASLT